MRYKHEGSQEDSQETPPPPRRSLTFAFVAAIVAGLIAFVGVQAYVKRMSAFGILSNYFIPKPQTYFAKDRINVLVLGIDYNYDNKDQEYSGGARSDTIMAVSLSLPTDQRPKPSINVLSVLRDTDVILPNGHEDKINAAYADGGPKLAERVVAQFLGIPGFDRYVTLRVNATKQLIDAVGGIDIVPDETMNYDDNWGHLHIHFVGGKAYHMNGDQAVSYSRFRHDACGDPCRVKRQQQVMRTIVSKLRNDKLNDLLHLRDLIAVANRNIVTDLRPEEQLSLASAFSGLDLHDVKTDQVPFVADKELACCGNVLLADDSAKERLVRKYFLDPPPSATSVDRAAVAQIDPSTVRVQILNGSGLPGLGRRAADALRAKGFTITSIGNADSFSYDATRITVHSTTRPLAGERVRLALPPLADVIVAPDQNTTLALSKSDVTVILGRDYGATGQRQASTLK